MKAKYTIGHRVYSPGVEDIYGDVAPTWAPAVDLLVYSIAPTASLADVEPEPDRMAVMTLLSVLVPDGATLGPHDRYVIDGEEWEQEGKVGRYTRGPFAGPEAAGLVLNLKQVEG